MTNLLTGNRLVTCSDELPANGDKLHGARCCVHACVFVIHNQYGKSEKKMAVNWYQRKDHLLTAQFYDIFGYCAPILIWPMHCLEYITYASAQVGYERKKTKYKQSSTCAVHPAHNFDWIPHHTHTYESRTHNNNNNSFIPTPTTKIEQAQCSARSTLILSWCCVVFFLFVIIGLFPCLEEKFLYFYCLCTMQTAHAYALLIEDGI